MAIAPTALAAACERRAVRLCHRSDSGKTLVHDTPEGSYCLGLVVKKVLEKPRTVERGRIGVPLTIFTQLTHPISGFSGIKYLEQAARIEIRPAGVIQNSIIVSFDSYDERMAVRASDLYTGRFSAAI
ncbi:MAG: hypothetical protein ACLQOO_16930 [Terriglobia bacterium]